MKKLISFLLVPVMIFCMFPLYCAAADTSDIICSYRWKTGPYYSKKYSVCEIILSPKYVKRGDVKIVDRDNGDTELTENEDYSVCRRNYGDYGECFIITVVSNGVTPYLKSYSFKDKDGRSNATIYLLQNLVYTEKKVAEFDREINLGANSTEAGNALTVKFFTEGTVTFDGSVVAENVYDCVLGLTDPGEHTLVLSVNGLTVGVYTITVLSVQQMSEDRIAALKSEMRQAAKGFFTSLPLSLITLPMAPLLLFGWMPGIIPFAPIEYAGRFFDALSGIRSLKAQR